MKFRPQMQLRFRSAEQFVSVKAMAASAGLSDNEWVLQKIEAAGGLKNGVHGESVGEVDGGREASGSGVRSGVRGGTGKGRGTSVHAQASDARTTEREVVKVHGVAQPDRAPGNGRDGTLRETPEVAGSSPAPVKSFGCPECGALIGHQKWCKKK